MLQIAIRLMKRIRSENGQHSESRLQNQFLALYQTVGVAEVTSSYKSAD